MFARMSAILRRRNCAVAIIRRSCFLDLHGLTQLQVSRNWGALIAACRREHVFCACVMHGHGKHILKQQTPLWLAQHPHVMAFHQAPKEYGGDAALLVLIEVEEWLPPELP